MTANCGEDQERFTPSALREGSTVTSAKGNKLRETSKKGRHKQGYQHSKSFANMCIDWQSNGRLPAQNLSSRHSLRVATIESRHLQGGKAMLCTVRPTFVETHIAYMHLPGRSKIPFCLTHSTYLDADVEIVILIHHGIIRSFHVETSPDHLPCELL